MARKTPFWSWSVCVLLLSISSLFHVVVAEKEQTQWIQSTNSAGETVYLKNTRKPSLYTQNFGDCLGSSVVNVTRFDAAYYKDNMTVLFHLQGNTQVRNESLMMYIGVYAYGESRFDLTFNPCSANIASLCPMNRSVPIEANGIIPVAQSDVAGIPAIALTIPDFEGEAILRIFANSTQSEIGCYSALVTNGATFSHPSAVGTSIGVFVLIAVLASFATAIYGDNVPTMRTHYAHSLSVFVIFSVLQHIFFTGALSMNWPSVLTAWWSNFAWAGGMIYSRSMQNSINHLIGSNSGNTTSVGAASSGSNNPSLGGGYNLHQIYQRSVLNVFRRDIRFDLHDILKSNRMEHAIAKRDLANVTEGYRWYGYPVKPGLPLPGNYSGFAGTLSPEGIPASNAFMTGFLWYLILVVCVAAAVIAFKWFLEGLGAMKAIKNDRLAFFRAHWLRYTLATVLRTMFIGFFMIILLALFQFTYQGSGGVTAIAAIIFILMFAGTFSLAAYACYYRIRTGRLYLEHDRMYFERAKILKFLPWYKITLESQKDEKFEEKDFAGSLPLKRISYVYVDAHRPTVHEDIDYITKFGWLAARFRRTRWWTFALWLVYEFVRACFYGGAAGHPMVQVFGILVVEIIALAVIFALKPFEGARLNALMVYLLGFSKVASVALSAAFDARFNLGRIITTVLGIVIIVIQGILTIVMLIAIVVGVISTYLSITRNREEFKPRSWTPLREKYLRHLDKTAVDLPPPPPPLPEEPKEPYFSVTTVRRYPKIEDEDIEGFPPAEVGSAVALVQPPAMSRHNVRMSRANSTQSRVSYTSLPYGARAHRASWSSSNFNSWHENGQQRFDSVRFSSAGNSVQQPLMSRSADDDATDGRPGPSVLRPQSRVEVLRDQSRVEASSSAGRGSRFSEHLVSPSAASEGCSGSGITALIPEESSANTEAEAQSTGNVEMKAPQAVKETSDEQNAAEADSSTNPQRESDRPIV
ncbi:MAG: hypothetical protein M1819_004141 [Sarea resinae]|nr:MAG: hypothetical protein M1819_004141 [Sarea resinae]